MSEADGMDNPAFSNEDECIGTSANQENSCTESQQEHGGDNKLSPTCNGGSFVSQHYIEPTRKCPEVQYKTETRIEVPGDEVKTQNNGKANGVHGNGNNNDVSFLNTSATSVQNNDGKKEQIEAVNLELVSMRPYTGNNLQTKGQEACELPSDPYEEYFVPVNEHRKYISSSPNAEIETTVAGVRFDLGPGVGREGLSLRDPTAGLVDYSHWLKALRGEKLYVTKDKRSKNSYWRRVACWTFGLTVLALALVIAILAATGVILTQEATKPLENDQPRLFSDVNAAGSQEYVKNPPRTPPPETSSFPPWHTTDETLLKTVPEALDGKIWFDNLVWTDNVVDVKSRVYRRVVDNIENNLRDILHPTTTKTVVKIYNVTNDGQVMFRISYPPASTPELTQEEIEKALRQNGNMIGEYHLGRMHIKRLIDECDYNYLNCVKDCKFDYPNGAFSCICLPEIIVDASVMNCIYESDLSDVNINSDDTQSTTVKDIFQGRSQAPDSSFEPRGHDNHKVIQDHFHHHNQNDYSSYDHDHQKHHGQNEFVTESVTILSSEPTSEPKSESESFSEPIAEPKPELESASEPTVEPKPEPESASEPIGEPKPEPESVSEPTVEPKPELESASEPTVEPKPEPESASEPTVEPKPEPESASEPIGEPKPEPESVSEPTTEPKSEPEPSNKPTAEMNPLNEPTIEPKSEPEPSNEPTVEPKAEPEATSDLAAEPQPEPEPSSEPTIESKFEPKLSSVEPTAEPKFDPESASEPITKPEPEPSSDPTSEPKSDPESPNEPTTEPKTEFESSRKSTIVPKSELEPSSEPVNEPKSELEPSNTPKSEFEFTTAPEWLFEPRTKSKSVESSETTSITQSTSILDTISTAPSESKSIVETITTHAVETTVEPMTTIEPLAVIPLTSDDETKTSTMSKDSTMELITNEETPTTQEMIETLPTAIPKIDIMQSDGHHHNEYDEGTSGKSPMNKEKKVMTMNIPNEPVTVKPQSTDINMNNVAKTTARADKEPVTNIPPMSSIPVLPQGNHTMTQLTPEQIDPYALIHNVLGINVTTESSTRNTSISNNIPLVISTENNNGNNDRDGNRNTKKLIEITTETVKKLADDMFKFSLDARDKEISKKAPRLDKDEQDFPNPFEPNVEDVIIHHRASTESTITLNNNTNGTEFTDLNNDTHLSHDVRQSGTTREEDISMLNIMTTMTSAIPMTEVPGVALVIDLEQRHIDDMNSKQLTNDTHDERGNNADIAENTKQSHNHTMINDESKKIGNELSDKNNDTTIFRNKFDDNVEDQYNDIFDENISKKFKDNQRYEPKLSEKNLERIEAHKIVPMIIPEIRETTTEMLDDMQTTIDTGNRLNILKTTTSESTLIKLVDDNKFTTEVPIMPIEIQQEFSTTEIIESTDSTAADITDNSTANFSMTTTVASTLETKTTAQIPILPEELQTTEASTTERISLNANITTESAISSINNISKNSQTNVVTSMPEVTIISDIKPVSEIIADDPEPESFDITRFFTTTERILVMSDTSNNPDEEILKVIPLDGEYNETNDNDDEVKEKNHFHYPRLSIYEIPPANKSENQNIDVSVMNKNITNISNMTNKSLMSSITTESSRQTPEIIPVYEQIEENEENPMFNPIHVRNNILQLKAEKNVEKHATANPTMTSSVTDSIVNMQNNLLPTFMFSKCNAGQFPCANGTSRDGAYCVNLSSKCDSENDCSDGSDEMNCEDAGCPGNFQCRSGQCLGRHLVCNGIHDCDDGSDEKECEKWTCLFDEFKCPNRRCIPDLWRCNGRPDCEDHRDEYSCSESCGNDEYLCPTENWCIPQTWRCNGIPECANGEDEKLCDCALDQFKCQTGGCVASKEVCDGIEHCPDLSDEWDCLVANMSIGNVTQIINSEDQTVPGAGQQPTILKIKQADNMRYMVCADKWNKTVSDSYCRSLGYFGSETTQTLTQKNEGEKFLRLKENYREDYSNFVSYLEITDSCATGEVVKISCQEFSCSSVPDNEGPTARLVGGTPAGEGQWSSVTLLKEMKNGAACTASVLGPMHALASYSCIHKYRQSDHWELFIGRDLQKSIAVKNIIPYPQVKYNQFMYDNDIALIQLEQPLVFSRNVSAVCLPSQQLQPTALCVTVGWGFSIDGDVNLKLNFLPIPIYDTAECNATSHYAGFISESNICAGFTSTDKGTCYNDEGAPLMCATETDRWEIQGLLSHHSRCSRRHPAIYSSLNPAISWLQHLVPALQIRT